LYFGFFAIFSSERGAIVLLDGFNVFKREGLLEGYENGRESRFDLENKET